jgi:Cd2+/Zn2+-exporting ATPase
VTRSYRIENLDCADCAARLERGLKGIAWISSATVNFAAATLTVDTERHERIGEDVRGLEPGLLVTPRQEAAVKRSGSADDRPAKGKKPGPAAILVAAGAAYAAALAAGFAFPSESPPFSAVRAAVLIAVWIVSGRSVVRKAFSNVLKGRPMDEHFLMTLASAAAFALGAFSEAAGVMLFYAAGELLQSAAVRKSRNAITGLISLSPERARREGSSGIEWIAVEEIVPGDILSVGPGERVPVDARLESGRTSLDSSAMTGESRPVAAGPGDEVRAGSLNLDASIRALALRPASESYIARMLSLVEEASGRKARTERFFTAFARIYTPIVVLAALATAVAPPLLLAGAAWGDWIYRALTLLIVSCPCALVISVPLAYFAGIGRGAREGILFKGSDSIDSLAAVGTIVFDKTGTLTSGEFAVRGTIPAPGIEMAALLEAALSVEAESTHPIGKSIVAWIDSERPELKARPSAGRAVVGGRGTKVWGEGFSLLAGNAEFMSEEGVDGFVPPEGRTDGMLAGATGRESEGKAKAYRSIWP